MEPRSIEAPLVLTLELYGDYVFLAQVKGKGKIVTKRWIEDCHVEKRRVPWREYRLDDGSSGSDSDDGGGGGGGGGGGDGAVDKTESKNGNGEEREWNKRGEVKDELKNNNSAEDQDDEYAGTTDVDTDVEEESRRPGGQNDEDPDTEDELQKVIQKTIGKRYPSLSLAPPSFSFSPFSFPSPLLPFLLSFLTFSPSSLPSLPLPYLLSS